MSRPFLFIGIAALIASLLSLNNLLWSIVVLFIFSVFITGNIIKRSKKVIKGVVSALIFVLIVVRIVTVDLHINNINKNTSDRVTDIEGTVTEIQSNSKNYSRFIIKIEEVGISSAKGNLVQASMPRNCPFSAGDRIKATVKFDKSKDRYKSYSFSNGIYFSVNVESVYLVKRGTFTVYRFAHDVREAIRRAVREGGSGEKGAVLTSLIIGDTTGISQRLSTNVKVSGVSHMLVVSGMHLGIICGILIKVLHRRTRRWVSLVVGLIAVCFITITCLFHISILRASIAYFVMLLGRAIKRNSDGLNSLGLGVTVAVILWPYIAYNVAFLLSISATFAVLYPAQMLMDLVTFRKYGLIMKPIKWCYDVIAISFAALICTLPVVGYFFGYVALMAPITNLLVTLPVNIALICGVVATLFWFIPFVGKIICLPLYFVARICTGYFIDVVNYLGDRGYGVIEISKGENIYCFFILITFILLVKVIYEYKMRKKEGIKFVERENA